MASKALPSPEVLRQLLRYEPDTGKLFWRERGSAAWDAQFAGKEALTGTVEGYRRGKIGQICVRAHRVIWAMMHDCWPQNIDHINGNREDNRLANLRDVSVRQNAQNMKRYRNNTSGCTGVFFYKATGLWRARIRLEGKEKHLGFFTSKDAAIAARKAAESDNGFHENHGRN